MVFFSLVLDSVDMGWVASLLTIGGERLALLDVLHEVLLLLVDAGREALLLGIINHLPDELALLACLGLCCVLLRARLSSLFSSQVSSEARVYAPLVVEVDGISYFKDVRISGVIFRGWGLMRDSWASEESIVSSNDGSRRRSSGRIRSRDVYLVDWWPPLRLISSVPYLFGPL